MVRLIFLLAVCLLIPALCSAREMNVTVAPDLSSVEITVSAGMGALEAQSDEIWQSLKILANARLKRGYLRPIDAEKPVVYQVSLNHSSTQWGIARWHRPLRLSDWAHWLLTPASWSMTRPFALHIDVPNSGAAILPFQIVDSEAGRFHYNAMPVLPDHGGIAIFGNAQIQTTGIAGSNMTFAIIGEATEETERLFSWVETVAEVAMDVHGVSPGRDSLVVVVPVPFVGGVLPWAHVRRGGGSHIIVYVKEDAPETELYEDWTLFHDMTHLYHPYLRSGGRWVSEGFASYFQNVYRSQAGVVEPDFAYSRLRAGMERGRKENANDGNRRVTDGGRMRTYWTAAAMALAADLKIRRLSGGELTLSAIMGRFAANKLPAADNWHPRDYMSALDEEIGVAVMVPLYDEYVRDRLFPRVPTTERQWRQIFTSG